MTKQEREILTQVLRKSILTMCRETMTSPPQFEVDCILCITPQNSPPIVIKFHELMKADQHPLSLCIHQDSFRPAEANTIVTQELRSCLQRPFPSLSMDGVGQGSVQSNAKRLHGHSPGVLSCSSPSVEGDCPVGMSSDEDARSFRLSPPSDTSQSRHLPEGDLPEDLTKTSPTAEQSHALDFGRGSPSSDGQSSVNGGVFAVKRGTPLTNADMDMEASSSKGSPAGSGNSEEGGNSNTPSHLSNGSLDIPSNMRGEGGTVKCPRCLQTFSDVEALDAHNLREHALFTCRICCRGFTARNNLKRHIRLHTGVKPFKCPHCSHAFSRKDDLKGHVLRHSYSKPFRCSLCTKGYTDRSCVRNHMAKEHGVRLQHVCPQCGEGFSDSKLFTEHKKLHPEFRSFRCKHCSFIGINPLMYMKHLLVHEERSFACTPCSETFSDPFEYSEHLKQHRGDDDFKSYACCFCSSILPSHEQFMRHEYTHAQGKAHTCNVCQKVFRFPSSLKDHMEIHRLNSGAFVNNTTTTTTNNNSDSQCNLEERFAIRMGDKLKEHVSPQPTSSVTRPTAGNSGTQYYCTECQVGFESEDVLQEHIVQAHEMPQSQNDGSAMEDDDSMTPQDLSLAHKSSRDEPKTPTLPQPSLAASHPLSLLNGDSILKRTLQGAALVAPPTSSSSSATIDLSQTKSILLARKRQMSASPNGMGHIDLSQTKVPLLSLLERKNESMRRLQEARSEGRQQVQTATFSINGDFFKIKKEAVSDEEGEGDDYFSSFNHLSTDLTSMRSFMNGMAGHDSGKESPDGSKSDTDNGGERPGDVAIERMHIRAPGFERVVTPDVLFRDRTSLSCQQCSDVFTDFASFETHSSEQHRRFVCEYCGKSFTAKPNRDRHVRYHTGVRPYKCHICDQKFFRGDDLKYHRTTRHASITS